MEKKTGLIATWHMFSAEERRNIAIYMGGIMLYRFGLEVFNGSIIALAIDRYDWEAARAGTLSKTFERVGLLTGLNQAFQCVGSILIAPLIRRYPTKNVLSIAILIFGCLTAILLNFDAGTGGRCKPRDWEDEEDFSYYGNWNTDGLTPVYCITGIAYGMVEPIRRVIPRDIVGGNVQKLRRMDAIVHVFYEIAGTSGSFYTALGLIPYFGNNFSFIITPICFAMASIVWFFITKLHFARTFELEYTERSFAGYCKSIARSVHSFFLSAWSGIIIVFSSRRYIWLLPGFPCFLWPQIPGMISCRLNSLSVNASGKKENGIAPLIARRYLGNSAWAQIMVGGSNFGELLGALTVFLFTNLIHTLMPWLRLDAVTLLIIWYLGYWYPPQDQVKYAWIVAATFIPISYGWAAGDVSLAAYFQASLARLETTTKDVSALGSVMSFLYCTYIVIYAILNPVLGRYVDGIWNDSGETSIHPAIRNIGGVQFTVLCGIMLLATLIPKGAIAFNPPALYGEALENDIDGLVEKIPSHEDDKDVPRKGSVTAGLEDAILPEEPSPIVHHRIDAK